MTYIYVYGAYLMTYTFDDMVDRYLADTIDEAIS